MIVYDDLLTSVKVDPDLQSSVPGPPNCIIKMLKLALNIRITRLGVDSPVSNGDADMIQSSPGNSLKVVGVVEGRPMFRE